MLVGFQLDLSPKTITQIAANLDEHASWFFSTTMKLSAALLYLANVASARLFISGTTNTAQSTSSFNKIATDDGRVVCESFIRLGSQGSINCFFRGYSMWAKDLSVTCDVRVIHRTPHGSWDFLVKKDCEQWHCGAGIVSLRHLFGDPISRRLTSSIGASDWDKSVTMFQIPSGVRRVAFTVFCLVNPSLAWSDRSCTHHLYGQLWKGLEKVRWWRAWALGSVTRDIKFRNRQVMVVIWQITVFS